MSAYKRMVNQKRFEKELWAVLVADFYGEQRGNGAYTIHAIGYGVIDIYPKGDKLCIRKGNKWIKGAFDWIEKTLVDKLGLNGRLD